MADENEDALATSALLDTFGACPVIAGVTLAAVYGTALTDSKEALANTPGLPADVFLRQSALFIRSNFDLLDSLKADKRLFTPMADIVLRLPTTLKVKREKNEPASTHTVEA